MRKRFLAHARVPALLLLLVLVVSACGTEDEDAPAAPAAPFASSTAAPAPSAAPPAATAVPPITTEPAPLDERVALRTALDDVHRGGIYSRLIGEPTFVWGARMTRGEARELAGSPMSPGSSEYARRDQAVWYFVFAGTLHQTLFHELPRPPGATGRLTYTSSGPGFVGITLNAFTGSGGQGVSGPGDYGQSQLPVIEIPADIYDTEPAPPAPAAPVATAAPPATPATAASAPARPPLPAIDTDGWALHEFGAAISTVMTVRLPPGWTVDEREWGIDFWSGAFVGPDFRVHLSDLGYGFDSDIFRITGGGPYEVDPGFVAQHDITVEPLDGGTVTIVQPREGIDGITGALFRIPDAVSMTVKARGLTPEQQAVLLAIIRTMRPGGG